MFITTSGGEAEYWCHICVKTDRPKKRVKQVVLTPPWNTNPRYDRSHDRRREKPTEDTAESSHSRNQDWGHSNSSRGSHGHSREERSDHGSSSWRSHGARYTEPSERSYAGSWREGESAPWSATAHSQGSRSSQSSQYARSDDSKWRGYSSTKWR